MTGDDRIRFFNEAIRAADLADDVKSQAVQYLQHAQQAGYAIERIFPGSPAAQAVHSNVDGMLDNLRAILTPARNTAVLQWVTEAAHRTADSLDVQADRSPQLLAEFKPLTQGLRGVARTARLMLDSYSLEDERSEILDAARRTLNKVESAAEKAQESAGVVGGLSLSTHFETYARGERRAAEVFRGLAMVGVLGALIAAVAFGPVEPGDWTHLTYRVATVAAVGTLAAYFARQAGQHRRVYNWAKSLSVQLKSFPAFIEPVPEEERPEIYRAFARRVLSAPPEKGAEGTEDSVGSAQLLDLVTSLAKRV